ncbi:hypothetical protein O7599_03405 [Streptomyces sp. WMMC500]|uniref:hypothetical protein n=1 Tax=Streptomyces sp. WMMC500 TaxID=3015154 RepID=UPI00248B88A3|nr:hypothetical protein [Streptomyces sp. WMMC500]WBB61616.1 hypothetical protein O7599_03405 [Streptomyces sp. WMMC500]
MAYGRRVRRWGVPAALFAVLSACGAACDSGGDPEGKATPDASDSAQAVGGDAAAPPTPEADPERVPRTAAQARRMIEDVIVGPELFGSRAVRATPYESDPARWTVLAEDCAWRTEELPDDVLATLTRYFEIPAADGKGPVELSATVTVHRTTLDAAWEQARMLEEAVGCPEQTLRAGERLTGLTSMALARGEGANETSDDSLSERGECVSDTRGGPYPYSWDQSTFGPVVVGVSVCAGEGSSAEDAAELAIEPLVTMMQRVQNAVAREDADGESSTAPGTKEGD